MGGYSYDRDVYSSSSSSSWSSSSNFGASSYSTSKLSSTTLDYSMEPNGKIIKSTTKSPIIIVLDVTGSNINFARVVYDKLPMFYGQMLILIVTLYKLEVLQKESNWIPGWKRSFLKEVAVDKVKNLTNLLLTIY